MRAGSALFALLLAGCPPAPPDDTEPDSEAPEPFACSLRVLDPAGDWVAAEGAKVELWLGFQGLLMAFVRAEGPADAPTLVEAVIGLELAGVEPFGVTQPEVDLAAEEGGLLTEDLLLFFPTSAASTYDGLGGTLAVRLRGDGRECLATATVTTVDEDPCIYTGDTPLCPGDSGMP